MHSTNQVPLQKAKCKALRDELKRARLCQQDVAVALGLRPGYLRSMLNGFRVMPDDIEASLRSLLVVYRKQTRSKARKASQLQGIVTRPEDVRVFIEMPLTGQPLKWVNVILGSRKRSGRYHLGVEASTGRFARSSELVRAGKTFPDEILEAVRLHVVGTIQGARTGGAL